MPLLLLITVVTAAHPAWGSPLRGDGDYIPAPAGASPPCARTGATFCETVDKYPTELIQKLLQSKSFDQSFTYTDESQGLQNPPDFLFYPTPTKRSTGDNSSRKTRSVTSSYDSASKLADDVGISREKCKAVSKTIRPQAAQNNLGQWRYVAKESKPMEVQLCSDQKGYCGKYCTQQYSLRPLLSLDPAGHLIEDLFFLPSVCACTTYENASHLAKMNT